jgi:hypothetical protein
MIYTGICEDNHSDPLKLGRIKVRVFGVHTDNKLNEETGRLIKTEDLPWASPCYPANTQSIDGLGDFSVPAQGSIVMIVFLDQELQYPVYMGTIPKMMTELPDFTKGFSDPDKEHPNEEYKNESSLSRLTRNEKIDKTIIKTKKDEVQTGIDCKETAFDQPETKYNTEYPNNRVIETKSGHFIELDDTEGAERIHIYHKSGTNTEYFPDGEQVDVVKATRTTIIVEDDNILIQGNKNIHISGSKNIHIEGSDNILIDGNRDKDIKGDEIDDIQGNMTITVNANSTINTTENTSISTGGNTSISTGGNTSIHSDGETSITADGNTTVDSAGTITVTGSSINLN